MAKDTNKRTLRDQAGVGPDASQTRHLMPLHEMNNVRIASGEPDIRGWAVWTSSGRELGEVEDLLVDPSQGQVVMIDVDLKGTDRHSLAPIRAAWIDRAHKRVVLDASQLPADAALPSLARTDVTDDDARRFGEGYARTWGDRGWDEDNEWRVRRANEELRMSRRRADVVAPVDRNEREITPAELDAAARAERRDDTLVERRRLRDDERWVAPDEPRDVRYARFADAPPVEAEQVVVEEHIVRRRVVDPAELSPEERDRIARERGADHQF